METDLELEQKIATAIEEEYKQDSIFLSAYFSNPNKVNQKIIRRMGKVIPINIKRIIFNMVKELSTTKPDDYVA